MKKLALLTALAAFAGGVQGSSLSFDDYPPSYKVTFGTEWANSTEGYSLRDGGLEYVCNISVPSSAEYLGSVNATQLEVQKAEAIKAVTDFNSKHSNECVYRELGYWSYRVCFSRDFTQFHYTGDKEKVHETLETDPDIQAHRLGYMRPSKLNKPSDFEFVKSPDGSRYLSQLVANGSVCDLTGRDRTVFVQYKCDPTKKIPQIEDVDELKTCQYRMLISSAELCEYPVLRPEEYISEANISCNPLRKENDISTMLLPGETEQELLVRHEKLDLTDVFLMPMGEGIFMGRYRDTHGFTEYPNILVSNKVYIKGKEGSTSESEQAKIKEEPQEPDQGNSGANDTTTTTTTTTTGAPEDEEGEVAKHLEVTQTDLLHDIGQAFSHLIKNKLILTPKSFTPSRPLRQGDQFQWVAEVYGLNREYIANVAIEQNDNDFLVAYYVGYGSKDNNFVSFTAGADPASEAATKTKPSQQQAKTKIQARAQDVAAEEVETPPGPVNAPQ